MEADAMLTSDEKKSKTTILALIHKHQELYEKLDLERNIFEVYNFDHFQEINRVIELQREDLKKKIDEMSDVMIKISKKRQVPYKNNAINFVQRPRLTSKKRRKT
jgi:hypothetical protein